MQLGWIVSLSYVVFTFAVPKQASPMYGYFMMPIMALSLLMFWQLIRAAWRRVRGATMALIGISLLVASMINDSMVYIYQIPMPYVGHYGMVAFIFCQSMVVGSNFAFAFRTADKLSKDLQLEVARQTRDAGVAGAGQPARNRRLGTARSARRGTGSRRTTSARRGTG